MVEFDKLLELAELRALHAAIEPTIDSVYRMRCRDYSVKFHTPLHVVENELDPLYVFQHLYEDKYPPNIVRDELDELLEKLYTIQDPTYSKISQEAIEELVDAVMNKEVQRALKKKPVTQQTIAEDIKAVKVKRLSKSHAQSNYLSKAEWTFRI